MYLLNYYMQVQFVYLIYLLIYILSLYLSHCPLSLADKFLKLFIDNAGS